MNLFEKEAEEYYYKKVFAETNPKNETELKEKFLQTFKDGAEFGYNKAKEEYEAKINALTLNHDELIAENERLEERVGELEECY